MRRTNTFNVMTVLLVLGLIISITATVLYGNVIKIAGSADCETQSAWKCEPSHYRNLFVLWLVVTTILIIASVYFTFYKLKRRKNPKA